MIIYTEAEMEAYRLVGPSLGGYYTSGGTGNVDRAASHVLDLAERIKNERARLTLHCAANGGLR